MRGWTAKRGAANDRGCDGGLRRGWPWLGGPLLGTMRAAHVRRGRREHYLDVRERGRPDGRGSVRDAEGWNMKPGRNPTNLFAQGARVGVEVDC